MRRVAGTSTRLDPSSLRSKSCSVAEKTRRKVGGGKVLAVNVGGEFPGRRRAVTAPRTRVVDRCTLGNNRTGRWVLERCAKGRDELDMVVEGQETQDAPVVFRSCPQLKLKAGRLPSKTQKHRNKLILSSIGLSCLLSKSRSMYFDAVRE